MYPIVCPQQFVRVLRDECAHLLQIDTLAFLHSEELVMEHLHCSLIPLSVSVLHCKLTSSWFGKHTLHFLLELVVNEIQPDIHLTEIGQLENC